MTMRRMVMTAGGAMLPIAVIALLFGNQWVVKAIGENAGDGGLWPLLRWVLFTEWRLYPGDTPFNWGYILSVDFALIVFLVLIAAFTAVGVRALDPNRGTLGALVTGWWATVVAGGVSGLIGGFLVSLTLDIPVSGGLGGPPSFDTSAMIWSSISGGAAFGLAYGWLAGLGALGGFALTGGGRGFGGGQSGAQQPFAQQPQFGQQPYAPQQGMAQQGMPQQAMQQPMQQQPMQGQQPYAQPQNPAAVPYVPQQGVPGAPQPGQPGMPQPGAPEQPAWGGVPQQPVVPPPAPEQPAPQPPAQPDDETVPAEGQGDLADKTMLDSRPEGLGDQTMLDYDPNDVPKDDAASDDAPKDDEDRPMPPPA